MNFVETKKLANCREERGKPEAGISVDIKLVLEKYNVSHAAYHGGDYNGVSCWRLAGNCDKIMKQIPVILETKKNETCDNTTINEKVKQVECTLGLLDVAFYYLNIPHPTDDEKIKAR
jgi:hypothetical protein